MVWFRRKQHGVPSKQPALRRSLFADLPLNEVGQLGPDDPDTPWSRLHAALAAHQMGDRDMALRQLHELLRLREISTQLRLQAHNCLRQLGDTSAPKTDQARGLIVELAEPDGLSTLAVYDDHAAVLITRDGRVVRSNAPDCARDDLIEAMLQGGNRVVERTHHDSHPQHTPELGHGAIHVLTYAGMHSGSSPLVVLHGDDIAAPILDHAAKLRAAMLAG